MGHAVVWLTFLALSVSLGHAQDQIPERLLIASGQQIGSGARALGLGGAYAGVADDYSAVWWNPAGLAQVKRIEVQGSLINSYFHNQSSYFQTEESLLSSNLTLPASVGFVFPVPVYQGALTFAMGYTQVTDFSRDLSATTTTADADWTVIREQETGRMGLWNFASAVDVSPNLALGASMNYWRGKNEYSLIGDYPFGGSMAHTEQVLNTTLSGWNFTLGGLFRAGSTARVGVAVHTPFAMSLNEEFTFDGDDGFFDYKMTYPTILRLGASVAPGRWLFAGDVEYRDWTALAFRTDTPFEGVTKAEANQQIADSYQNTTRISLGGEYLFPAFGLRGRAGVSFEPSNYRDGGSDADKTALSLGLSMLIDRSVMVDTGFRTTAYSETLTPGLKEDIRSSTALVTISYRM